MPPVFIESIAVGVYGNLPSTTIASTPSEIDCYGVFHGLTTSLGLTADDGGEGSVGLWGMNDAGGPWTGGDDATLCGWFQVGPPYPAVGPLPLVPLVDAAVATVGRFGEFRLAGLELHVPVQNAGSAYGRLLSGRSWFAPTDPSRRTRLRVTLDAGPDHDVAARSDGILDALGSLCPPGAIFEFGPAGDSGAVELSPPVPWRWWLGDGPGRTLTLGATVPEWTPIALGQAITYVAEACRTAGMRSPLGVRIAQE